MFRKVYLFLILLSSGCGLDLVHIEYNEKEFNSVANYVIEHPEIYQMDDFTRHLKIINGVHVNFAVGEQSSYQRRLKHVVDSLSLDLEVVSTLRKMLEETKLRDFQRVGDSVLFTVDGMVDTSWGYFYSRDSLRMDSAWFVFGGNAVLFTQDINSHWKKVAIK